MVNYHLSAKWSQNWWSTVPKRGLDVVVKGSWVSGNNIRTWYEVTRWQIRECLRQPVKVQISSLARNLEGVLAMCGWKSASEGAVIIAEDPVIKAEKQVIPTIIICSALLCMKTLRGQFQHISTGLMIVATNHVFKHLLNGFGSGKGTHLTFHSL